MRYGALNRRLSGSPSRKNVESNGSWLNYSEFQSSESTIGNNVFQRYSNMNERSFNAQYVIDQNVYKIATGYDNHTKNGEDLLPKEKYSGLKYDISMNSSTLFPNLPKIQNRESTMEPTDIESRIILPNSNNSRHMKVPRGVVPFQENLV